jgi:hypothetical protein
LPVSEPFSGEEQLTTNQFHRSAVVERIPPCNENAGSQQIQVDIVEQKFLTPVEVCSRYGNSISVRTLGNWRWNGTGPEFVKIGGKVLYKLCDLERWEESRKASSTSTALPT